MKKRGYWFEKRIKKYLQEQGFIVDTAGKRAMRMSGKFLLVGKDIFGCFDLIAVNKEGTIKFIQATTQSNSSKKEREIIETFPWPDGGDIDIEIWLARPGGDIIIKRLIFDKFQEVERIIRKKRYIKDKRDDKTDKI